MGFGKGTASAVPIEPQLTRALAPEVQVPIPKIVYRD
jgi:hypothetical protein